MLNRRDFLWACASASAGFLAAPLPGSRATPFALGAPRAAVPAAAPSDYRLIPHYKTHSALQGLIEKARQKVDAFPSEGYARQIEHLFSQFGAELRSGQSHLRALAAFLAPRFAAASPRPHSLERIRDDSALTVHRARFAPELSLDREAFLRTIQPLSALAPEVLVTDFKVAELEIRDSSPLRLTTHVRYMLVGTGLHIHRFERIGTWQIEWQQGTEGQLMATEWRPVEEIQSLSREPIFVDITATTLGHISSFHEQLLRGTDYWRTVLDAASGIDIYGNNGIAAGDYDNDGFDDLYICQPAGLPNRLYRNRGDGTFEDVTETAGVGVLENTPCALFADLNNNGYQDLVVVTGDGPLLFLNQGKGRFKLKPGAFRFAHQPQGTFTGAALGDYDRDGRLDIYCCLYSYYRGLEQYRFPVPYFDARNGPPNFLFHNESDGTFQDVTEAAGLNQNNDRYSFDCTWCDYDKDGWPDLYVVNDFGRKNLYHNNRNGTFTDVAEEAGVVDVGPGMSSCWFDYDNDLKFDLYVSDMWEASGMRLLEQKDFLEGMTPKIRALFHHHAKGNSLYRNLGNGHFEDRSRVAGIEKAGWSWSNFAWDFGCDGRSHLYVANGMISGPLRDDLESFFWQYVVANSPPDARPAPEYELGWDAINELIRSDGTWAGYLRNAFFYNNGDGTFSNISAALGLDFADDSRAFALADLDHDGRLEIVLKNRTAPQLRVLKNNMTELGAAIAFRLQGRKSPRDAIGATITVEADGHRQMRILPAGTGFCSQHSKEVFFGLGPASGTVEATIQWPSGLVQKLAALPIGHRVAVIEGLDEWHAEPFAPRREIPVSPPPEGAPLPTRAETWLLAPVVAPEFSLTGLDGKTYALSNFRGHPLLLNFWSAAAPDCGEELAGFERHRAQWAARGLQLAALNVDPPEKAAAVREFARAHRLAFPVLAASQDVAAVYNLLFRYLYDRHRDLPIPTSFLLDAQGTIVKVYQGPADLGHVGEDFLKIPHTAREILAKALPFPGLTGATRYRRNYLTLGSVYYRHGYMDPAAEAFRLALRSNPQSAEACYGLGSVYLKEQRDNEARQEFQRAVKLRAEYPDTVPNSWNNLGLLAARQGRTAEAIEDFQAALRLDPHYLIALKNLGNAYREQRRWPEARQALERALAVNPHDADSNYSLGMVYAALDDTAQARVYLTKALEARHDYPEALNNLGVLYLRTGHRDEAVKSFEKCMRVAPAFDQAYLNLARLHALEGHPAQARAVLEELLKYRPGDARARQAIEELGP